MGFEQFGSVQIFRPSLEVQDAIRQQARKHLFSRFTPGEYRGAKAANAIVQHQFQFYDRLLRPLIPKLASRGGAEFLLFQYDEAWRLLHGRGILDLREREHWDWIEPRIKKAIKFLVELICMEVPSPHGVRDRNEALLVTESALACAESMVDLAHQSDCVHSVFPNDSVVRVFDSGPYDFTVDIEGTHQDHDRIFSDRVIRDRESRNQFVPFPQFDNHTPTHQGYLDDAFTESFGMSYGEFLEAIISVINDCQPSLHPNAFPTLFVHRGQVIDELAKSGRSRSAIERAIEGFCITPKKLIAERRVVWNPKQESRAYRRGFYVLPHETGPHLAFSREMAKESLVQLANWVSYQHLPPEWKTPQTRQSLANLSMGAGKWFEDVVRSNLKSLGFFGQRLHRTVGESPKRLQIPDFIGEIDFLGFHPKENLLILIEAKMVMTGLEARYWRDDLDQFVFRSGSYAERFRRKLAWVSEHRHDLSVAMGFGTVLGLGAAMLTLYPCIARAFISDFPCVSLTELMLDYQLKSVWPYSLV